MDYTWSDKVLKLGLNHPIKDGKPLDLTLRLGQPISNDDLQSSYQGNEGTKYSENRLNGEILQLGTGGQFPTSLFPDIIGTFPPVGYSNNMTEFVGFPSNHHPFNYHLNIGFNNIPTAAAAGGSLLPSHEPNYSYGSYNVGKDDVVLPPLGNVENGAGSSRRRGTDLGKRCTNVNCNATETPMWRRGPLGPKTLCNACGIKFRKEEDRRKAREAAMNGTNTREA